MTTARREHKHAEGEPTVGFTSIKSLAKALFHRDRELPALTGEGRGDSLTELAAPEGCGKSKSCRGR